MQRRDVVFGFSTLAGTALLGCGGGEEDETVNPLGDLDRALQSDVTLDGGHAVGDHRARILSAAAQSALPTADEFFSWAENLMEQVAASQNPPGQSIFPKGARTERGVYNGVIYDFRYYPSVENYLGVVVSGGAVGAVYGLGTFTGGVLKQYGGLADYTCEVKPLQCGGVASAGTIFVYADRHEIVPNHKNGKITNLGGADGKGYEVAPSDIARVVWSSDRVGRDMASLAYGVPMTDGTIRVDHTPNNDQGQWSLITHAGVQLWFDVASAVGWGLAGDVETKIMPDNKGVLGIVEYGAHGYKRARVDYQGQSLVLDSGYNGIDGFSKVLSPGELLFVFMSDEDGWFLDSNKRGRLPSALVNGTYVVTIPGISCGQRGTIAVYKAKSGSGSSVVWDTTPYAWFVVPKWQAGSRVALSVEELLHTSNHWIALAC